MIMGGGGAGTQIIKIVIWPVLQVKEERIIIDAEYTGAVHL